MREDDVLVTLLHQLWAGCYSRSLAQSRSWGDSLLSMPPKEKEALFVPLEKPMRFSQQMLQDIDAAIQRYTVS